MDNLTVLVVHADRIEVKNRFPQVQAAVEPLKVAIDWSDNRDVWQSVQLGDVVRAGGKLVAIHGSMPEFRRDEGNVVKAVDFQLLEPRDAPCRCRISATRKGGRDEIVGLLDVCLLGSRSAPRADDSKPKSPVRRALNLLDKKAPSR